MADLPGNLPERIRALRAEFEGAVAEQRSPAGLQAVRDRYLGRKSGAVTALLKSLGALPEGARREAGRELNALKAEMEARLESTGQALASELRAERLREDRLEDIFIAMGYEVYEGREVEDDYHCFEALNMPPDHPARDMQDTFYLQGAPGVLLRTHTSSAQIRYMLGNSHPPRVRIICPGKVYRRDSDITHSPMFQQVEGLVVGPGVSLGDLKGTIETFLHALFGRPYPLRFRPSYFPYTEPSVETDLSCVVCGGSGCRVCKGTGWLEILGSGMVHPAVFEAVNARLGRVVYDPEEVTGFAFGLGIERVAMVKHGVDDIRLFYENDLRFLEQFRG